MNNRFRKSSSRIENEFCFVPENCPGIYDVRSGHVIGMGIEKERRMEDEHRDAAVLVLGEIAIASEVEASSE